MHERYEPVIGLEVHCQLSTAAKAFSAAPAAYGGAPNTQADPFTLGHPGTLPVLNRRVLRHALQLALALRCTVAERITFARKHYFYPDLPKGYQLTQHDAPLAYDGHVSLEPETGGGQDADGREAAGREARRIGIRRVHIEEDAAKLIHDRAARRTLVDHNRCGVPLVEVVTDPDLRAPHEAARFLHTMRQLVRYLGISDGNMEEGSLRCDANVSVRPRGRAELGARVELKNLNSFRHVEHALEHEVTRQIAARERGAAVAPETRSWDADARRTHVLRAKETARDYRYLPDPDLPPVPVDGGQLAALRRALPEMPAQRRARFVEEVGLPAYDAGVLTEDRAVADYFEAAVDALYKRTKGGNTRAQAKAVSNVIMSHVLRALGERADRSMDDFPVEADRLAALIHLRLDDEVGSSAAHDIFVRMLEDDRPPRAIADARNLRQVDSREALTPVVEHVLARHDKNVHRYRSGKKSLMRFFIGEVMSSFDGSPDPKLVRSLLEERLS